MNRPTATPAATTRPIIPEEMDISQSNHGFPFELSQFQRDAIAGIIRGQDVLVSAPTASGKTLPAEFAIRYYAGGVPPPGPPNTAGGQSPPHPHGGQSPPHPPEAITEGNIPIPLPTPPSTTSPPFRTQGGPVGRTSPRGVVFASPIKALSNQKFHDFTLAFPDISIGIITGDIQFNPAADVVIMTTEILRNVIAAQTAGVPTLFNLDMARVRCIVFDECHYIGDEARGGIWEQAIITAPAHIQLLMLSATLDCPEGFADWVGRARQRPVDIQGVALDRPFERPVVCETKHRETPLHHSIWFSGPGKLEKFEKDKAILSMFDEASDRFHRISSSVNKEFNTANYHRLVRMKTYMHKNRYRTTPEQILNDVAKKLKERHLTPAIVFVLSRKKLETYASRITVPMLEYDDAYPATIRRECEKILRTRLDNWQEYMALPECQMMLKLLEKGIAIHHAGILPVLQEMVELLFAKKHVKLLFATETFAVGLNMPAKATVFTGLQKFNGTKMRYLTSSEYTQMAGRAGRRGLDDSGEAIICGNMFELPDIETMETIVRGSPPKLTSKIKVTYDMVLGALHRPNEIVDTTETEPTETEPTETTTPIDRILGPLSKSMISDDINKELATADRRLAELVVELSALPTMSAADTGTANEYRVLAERLAATSSNQRKKIAKEMGRMRREIPNIEQIVESAAHRTTVERDIARETDYRAMTARYLDDTVRAVVELLELRGFLGLGGCAPHTPPEGKPNGGNPPYPHQLQNVGNSVIPSNLHERGCGGTYVPPLGCMAAVLREIHPLALVDCYRRYNGFRFTDSSDPVRSMAIFISCFMDLRGGENPDAGEAAGDALQTTETHIDGSITRRSKYAADVLPVVLMCEDLKQTMVRYTDDEILRFIDVSSYRRVGTATMDLFVQWYDAANAEETGAVLRHVADRGIFVGEFVKGLLKICNIARELELVCDIDCNFESKSYLAQVPDKILKSVATNQSLYVG